MYINVTQCDMFNSYVKLPEGKCMLTISGNFNHHVFPSFLYAQQHCQAPVSQRPAPAKGASRALGKVCGKHGENNEQNWDFY